MAVVGLAFAFVVALALRFVLVESRRLDATVDACKEASRDCERKVGTLEARQRDFSDELVRLGNRIQPGR